MGYRIHLATTYQVEYNCDVTPFSNKAGEINRFLQKHCPEISWEDGRECCEFATTLKISKVELGILIGWVATHREEYAKWAKVCCIDEGADQFIEILAFWIADSDPRNDYVVLTWF